jgi:hypothetical protein
LLSLPLLRRAVLKVVANTQLVVGDVLIVGMGDKVVADGIMIDGFHLVIDEASLTGALGWRGAVAVGPSRLLLHVHAAAPGMHAGVVARCRRPLPHAGVAGIRTVESCDV